jgi:hypothetical protein
LPALGTGPFFFFFPNEFSYSELLYIFLILNHAHRVLCPVTLVQVFEPGTGKIIANKTKAGSDLFSFQAISYPAACA